MICTMFSRQSTSEGMFHNFRDFHSYLLADKEPHPISVIAAFLRLGKKYGIDQLRSEAVIRLSFHFPTTLEERDKICSEAKLIKSNIGLAATYTVLVTSSRLASLV